MEGSCTKRVRSIAFIIKVIIIKGGICMEYEYDSIFYQWIGIEKTELYYEVHLVQLDEGFFTMFILTMK